MYMMVIIFLKLYHHFVAVVTFQLCGSYYLCLPNLTPDGQTWLGMSSSSSSSSL